MEKPPAGGIMKIENIPPPEIMLEIFSRLPIKSLLQIKCVCKQWYSLIRNPHLPTMHLARTSSTKEEALILINSFDPEHETPSSLTLITEHYNSRKPLLRFREWHHIGNVCHSLLCLVRCGQMEEVLVYNPLTGERLALPPGRPYINICGLGFDSSIKKYKMVRVYFRDIDWANPRLRLAAEVCTMGTTNCSSWREIISPPTLPIRSFNQGVYASGMLHWLVDYNLRPNDFNDSETMVISFDFEKEEFRWIPRQEFFSVSRWLKFDLVDLGGYLGMVDLSSSLDKHIEIWKLKDYEKNEWVREYRIDALPLMHRMPSSRHIRVVGLMGEVILLLRKHDHERYVLVAYNSKTHTLTEVFIFTHDHAAVPNVVCVHAGSLISFSP